MNKEELAYMWVTTGTGQNEIIISGYPDKQGETIRVSGKDNTVQVKRLYNLAYNTYDNKVQGYCGWVKVCFIGQPEQLQSLWHIAKAIEEDKLSFSAKTKEGVLIQSNI